MARKSWMPDVATVVSLITRPSTVPKFALSIWDQRWKSLSRTPDEVKPCKSSKPICTGHRLLSKLSILTIRLPHEFVYALAFPAAVAAFGFFVWPYRIFRRIPGLKALAEKLPMKQYADFPFKVCVNDQLDRFSAPIENRYTSQEVFDWLKRAALEEASVRPNYGWMGSGRKPVQPGP